MILFALQIYYSFTYRLVRFVFTVELLPMHMTWRDFVIIQSFSCSFLPFS